MGTKKINLMVEVDDIIYRDVVVQHKRNKTFTKLMSTLLKGYSENMVIRSYVEDSFGVMRREHDSILNGLVNDMASSLASMGMYIDEAKSNAQEGIDTFSGANEEAKSGLSAEDIKQVVNEENQELRNTVDSLKTQMSEMMDLLRTMVTNPQANQVVQTVPPVQAVSDTVKPVKSEVIKEEPKISTPQPIEEDIDISLDDEPIIPLQVVEDEEGDVNGDDVLANLLSGQQFSF